MNLTILTGPEPAANRAELFKRTPIGNGVCVVVPDIRSGNAIERFLVKSQGEALHGHTVFTLEGLSRAIISQTGFTPDIISNHLKRALLSEIVKSRIGNQSKFFSISEYPGFINLLASFLEDTRSGQNKNIFPDPDIVSITRAYESHLNRLGVTDHEGAVMLALEDDLPERFADSFSGSLIVDGFYDFTEHQLELLSRLVRHFTRSAITLVDHPSRPSLFSLPEKLLTAYRSLGAKIVEVSPETITGPGIVLSGFTRGEYSDPEKADEVQIHTFQSETSEADWVAGTIRKLLVAGECRAENIMIVARNEQDFSSPLCIALRFFGIPVEDGISRQLITHPLVKLLLDALDASINPEEKNIIKVQNSSFTGMKSSSGHFPIKHNDDRAWSCIITETDSPEGYAASVKKMLEWLNVRYNLTGGGNRERAVQELALYEKLLALLDEFAKFYTTFRPMMKAGEFSRLLRRYMENITLSERTANARGVVMLGVEHARYVERDVVFFTGLDNTSFPKAHENFSLHNPVTASAIRQHNEMEEPLLFYMSIAGAQRLFLTYPGIDDEGKDSSISPYLREIQEGIQTWSPPQKHRGVPGAAWEQGYATERGKLETVIRNLGNADDSAALVLSALRRQETDLSEKTEQAIRSHITLVEVQDLSMTTDTARGILSEVWGNDRIVAITDLETYLSCPAQFYFSRILKLKPERLGVDMLDPAERGSVIHEILANFYAARKREFGETAFSTNEIDENKKLMHRIIENIFDRRESSNKPLHPIVVGSEKRYIAAWMNYFIELEAQVFTSSQFHPDACEISFGDGSRKPLTLSVGKETVQVRGRIDRIDTNIRDNKIFARIIDYKTGQSPTLSEMKKGTVIQLPLYVKAAGELIMPDAVIEDGMYYSLKNAHYDPVKKKLMGCKNIGQDLENIIETAEKSAIDTVISIRNALFPAPEKCNDRCEWRSLCRGGRIKSGEVQDAVE